MNSVIEAQETFEFCKNECGMLEYNWGISDRGEKLIPTGHKLIPYFIQIIQRSKRFSLGSSTKMINLRKLKQNGKQ